MRDTRIIQLILLQGIYAKENMNRETFAHYGWIIIVASVMAALLLTATPIGVFIGDAAINIFAGYKDTGDSILDKDHISDKEDEWENVLFDGETFTATFITDGGTWEDGTTGNKTVDYDIKTELLAPAKVSKAGSTFLGWQVTTAGGNWTAELFNNPNQKKLFGAAGKHGNVVFTARWDSDAYTATFYPNNGIWDSKVTTALTSAYTSDDVLKAPTGISRLGYTFSGWKVTTADGNWTDAKIYKGATSVDVAGSSGYHGTVSFTATWTPNTYSITYNLNGGTSGGSQPATATFDTAFNVSNPTKAGFAFAGWTIKGMSDDCTHYYGDQTTTLTELTGVRATNFKNLRATNGTVTFTATWNAETYSIQYNLNQGTSPNAPSFGLNHPETALVGEGFTVNAPTMEGYNFVGWDITGMDGVTHYYGTSSSSNTTTKATSLEKVTSTWFKDLRGSGGIVKFTARWEPKTYNVTYGGNNYASVTVSSKGTFTQPLPFSWTSKTKTGYHYVLNSVKIYSGSNTSGVLLATYTTSTNATYTMTPKYYSDIFIFVDYAEVPNQYNISYDLNKGAGTTTPVHGTSHPTKGTYDQTVTISNPSREGYVFSGWNITGMDTVTHYYGSKTTTATSLTGIKDTSFRNLRSDTGTVKFTATWTPNTYSITYNLNGGTSGGTQPTTATFDVQFNVSKPSKTAYNFAGWTISGLDSTTHYYGSKTSTATTLTNIQDTQFKNLRANAGTVTFTANWTAATYNATFNTNGGTWNSGTTANKTVQYTVEKILSAPEMVTREGYIFSGWKLTSQTGGNWTANKVYNNATQTTLEGKNGFYGDLTFTAQWTPRTYTITYGGTYGTVSGPSTGTFDKGTSISWTPENATGYHYVLKTVKVYSGTNSSGTVLATYTSGSNASYTMTGKYYSSVYVHVEYQKIPNTYTINYNLNKGSSSNNPAYGTYHPTTGTYDAQFTVSHPTMLGYTFTGWTITGMDTVTHYIGSSTTTATSISSTKETTFKNLRSTSGTVTFKANWTPNQYSITYNLNRGNSTTTPSLGANAPRGPVNYDEVVTISNPSMPGYYFAGWDISGMDSTTHYYGSKTTTDVTIYSSRETAYKNLRATSGTVTFKATWIANGDRHINVNVPSCSIVYDLNKGTSTTTPKLGASAPTTFIYDQGFKVDHPTMSGWVFTGWTITGLDADINHYYGNSAYTVMSNAVSPATTPSNATTISLTKATYFINLKKSGTVTFKANWQEIVTVPSSQSFVYNGSSQQPTWVTTPPTGIVVTGQTSATNVGTYTATLTPAAGYCWSNGSTSSANVTWTITKRPITITGNSASKVYDGTALTNNGASITSGSLGSGDSATFSATGSQTAIGSSSNVPNIVIKKNGTDVTSNYSITKVNGTLTVTNRNITVKADSASKTYDGTALTKTSGGTVTSGALASGHTITVTNSGTITNVGTTNNTVTKVVVKDASGNDVTSNYNISTAVGTLTVTKRPITVTAGSSQKVYDGTALTNGSHTITSGSLVSGHTITVTNSGTITNVGSTSNPVSKVVIKNGSTDVTSNYSITTVAGTLKVTEKTLTVKAGTASKVYDGTALTNTNGYSITSGALASGHTITVTNSGTITNVGTATNTVSSVVIKDASGNNVTSNYTIIKQTNTLTITARPITITGGSKSKVYDGTALTYSNASLTSGSLASGQTATYSASGSITNVGTANNVPSVIIKNNSGTDVTSNYNITKVNGTLTVTNATMAVSKSNYSGTYDGTAHTGSVTVSGPSSYTIKYGTSSGSYTTTTIPTYTNAGTYTVYYQVTATNYTTVTGSFTVTINKRAITITGGSKSKTYDGTALTYNSASLTSGSLASGQTATYSASGSITNVGTANNVPNVVIKNSAGTDVTSNYTVTKANGKLTVSSKAITVKAADASKTYDGSALTKTSGGSVTSGALISGHTLTVTNTGSITNAGTTNNTISSVVIKDSSGTDVTANYTITKAVGTLTVNKRATTVTAASASKTYDGSALTKTSGGTASNLVSGHTATITNTGSQTAAGSSNNTVSSVVIKNSSGTDVTSNYTITKAVGTLTVSKRAITITGGSKTKIYDGTALTYNSASLTSGSIASGQTATYSASGSITNVGTANNVPSVVIKNSAGTDVTSNYTVTKVNGTLTVTDGKMTVTSSNYSGTYDGTAHTGSVTVSKPSSGYTIKYGTTSGSYTTTTIPTYTNAGTYTVYYQVTATGYNTTTGSFTVTINKRAITITGGSTSKTYDGTALTYNNASLTSGSLASGQTATYSSSGSITNAGTANNVPSVVIKNSSGTDVTSNYTVTKANGTLTVNKRAITVKADSASKTYDGSALTKTSGGTVTSGSLVSGHTMTVTNTGSITNAGTANNTVSSVVIKNSSGTDVTSNYNITKAVGTLTVSQKAITVKADNASKTYDGSALTKTSGGTVTSGSLVSGHTLTVTNTGSITNAGTANNTVSSVVIKNSSGTDVTANYSITKAVGTLTVNKRATTVTAASASKTYDGSALTKTSGGTASNLVSGHTATITNTGSITNVGSTNNTVSSVVIKNSSGTDVTSNYTITKAVGTLTVNAATISVSSSNYSGTYDGSSHTGSVSVSGPSSYTIKYGTSSGSYTTTTKPTRTDAGTTTVYYQVTATNYTTVTGSFTITINKRATTVTAASASKTYDGSALTKTSGGTATNLVSGHSATITNTGSITNVGSTNNTVSSVVIKNSSGTDVTSNYTVTKAVGTLTVNAATIVASSSNYSGVYDGAAHSGSVTVTTPSSGYTIKYGTTSGSYTTTTKPTRTAVGTTTVYYQITASNYTTKTGSFTITITEPPHSHSYSSVTYNAGCTQEGKTVYTCANSDGKCDKKTYESGNTAALGHYSSPKGVCGTHHHDSICSSTKLNNDVNVEHSNSSWNNDHGGHATCADGQYEHEGSVDRFCGRQNPSGGSSYNRASGSTYYCGYEFPYQWCWQHNGHSNGSITFACGGGSVKSTSRSISHGSCSGYECTPYSGYTVTFNANGGSGGGTVTSDSYYRNYTAQIETPTATRSGYTFKGWYSASSGGSLVAYDDVTKDLSGYSTLYAQWNCAHSSTSISQKNSSGNTNSTYHYKICNTCSAQTASVTHSWNVTSATCTTAKKCTSCSYVAASATGHSSVYGGTSAIHTKCNTCGVTISSSHSYTVDSGVQYTAATCTAARKNYKKCACGYNPKSSSYVVSTGSANGHSNVYGGTSAIHTKCNTCGVTTSSTHSYTVDSGTQYSAATCTANRKNYKKCACGYNPKSSSYVVEVANTKKDHTWRTSVSNRKYTYAYASGSNRYHYKYNTCACGATQYVSTDKCYKDLACLNPVDKSGETCYYCGHAY